MDRQPPNVKNFKVENSSGEERKLGQFAYNKGVQPACIILMLIDYSKALNG